jgi:hypothetical protein
VRAYSLRRQRWTTATLSEQIAAASCKIHVEVKEKSNEGEDFTGYMVNTHTEVLDEDVKLIDL